MKKSPVSWSKFIVIGHYVNEVIKCRINSATERDWLYGRILAVIVVRESLAPYRGRVGIELLAAGVLS